MRKIRFRWRNVVKYLLLLLFVFFLWTFFRSYYIGILTVLLVFLPVLSAVSLCKMSGKCTIKILLPVEPVEEGEIAGVEILLENNTYAVSLDNEMKIKFENIFFGDVSEITLSMPVRTKNKNNRKKTSRLVLPAKAVRIGCYRVSVEEFYLRDILGLFQIEADTTEDKSFTVIPKDEKKDVEIIYSYADKATENEESTKKGNDYSEVSGIREYIPGDLMRDIHWKLSSKRDILMIKERISMSSTELVIVLELTEKKAEAEIVLKELYSVCKGLIDYRIPVRILVWNNKSFEFESEIIEYYNELDEMYKCLLGTRLTNHVAYDIDKYMKNCFPHITSYVLMNAEGKEINKNIKYDDYLIADGLAVNSDDFSPRENRKHTLYLKGLVVYLLTVGAIGCVLTSLEIECYLWVIHIWILGISLYLVMLYYSKKREKLGYLILLIVVLFLGISFRRYINSGFYTIMNGLADTAAEYFGSDAVKKYEANVENKKLAVTISAMFIGSVVGTLINLWVSRSMKYIRIILLGLMVMAFPMYLEAEPSTLYVVMLLTGMTATYVFKRSGHYKITDNDNIYEINRKKNRISFVYNSSNMLLTLVGIFLIYLISASFTNIFLPVNRYDNTRYESNLKASTKDIAENIVILGMMGLVNQYEATGGMSDGMLGGISRVNLDNKTDLTVTFVPSNFDNLYIKHFVGGRYIPLENYWEDELEIISVNTDDIWYDSGASYRRDMFESGSEYYARGLMKITSEDFFIHGRFKPYYSDDRQYIMDVGDTIECVYYTGEENQKFDDTYEPQIDDEYLNVPEENMAVIENVCKQAGFSGNHEEIVNELIEYYEENIPYTLTPGATPDKKDFINYFLSENKRGFCAHFASAATLIFRYMGIPARYVEGYAIPAEKVLSLSEQTGEDINDYYEGYNELENYTGAEVVKVNVTDAEAHAWVEVYIKERGWTIVDVTPPSYEDDEETNGFFGVMSKLFGWNDATEEVSVTDRQTDSILKLEIDDGIISIIKMIFVFVIAMAAILYILAVTIKQLKKYLIYRQSSENDKIIILYARKIKKIKRKHIEFRDKKNYTEQVKYLLENGLIKGSFVPDEIINLLEKVGFSDVCVNEKEKETLKKFIKNIQ